MFSFWTIVAVILYIFAVMDVAKSNRDTATKATLIILILLFPIIGACIYLLVFRDKGN
jgi:phospholipase D-like protein